MTQFLLSWLGISIVAFAFGFIVGLFSIPDMVESESWDYDDFMSLTLRSTCWAAFVNVCWFVLMLIW